MNLIAKPRTISDAIRRLGWRKVPTRYCQIVEPRNCLKRFIYCCLCKKYKKKFENTIDADETTVELRLTGNANFTKPSVGLLTAAHGKIGKHKHNYKIHLFGGISRHGLTPLVMFTGRMYSEDYQRFMAASILPFIRTKLPYNHEFYMDNDPKHRSRSTESFMILHGINHFETPPQSPDLMPIEMVSYLSLEDIKVINFIYRLIYPNLRFGMILKDRLRAQNKNVNLLEKLLNFGTKTKTTWSTVIKNLII